MSKSTSGGTRGSRTVRRRHPRPGRLIGLAAAIAVLVCGCADDTGAGPSGSQEDQVAPIAKEELLKLPEATTFGKIPNAPKDPAPQSESTGKVVRVHDEVPVYAAKGGKPIARMPTKQLGSPTWLAVIDKLDGWYQVLLPSRPNQSTGWLRESDGKLEEATNDYLIKINLADFRLSVSENGKELGNWEIGIGKDNFPTPTGRTAIISSLEETVQDYSPIILPLGAHSDAHSTFGGGPGTVGIHGWPDDSVLGTKTSDGCVRVPKGALDLLSTLPLGTVVIIS
ncbi:MAG: L,D-transpeptidase family protein [Pseudonocardiaceae bacterium]|nr:L,D-transpeptidase family protein [Pseudonocardiaceae bacterium]